MKNTKGFTVVELVIVLTLIALLAAVLIPTIASLLKRTDISRDQQLIRNLNAALASNRKKINKPHATMTEALEAAEEFGYEVGKINASGTDNEILWDLKNDVFCYYDVKKDSIEYIPESIDESDKPADISSSDYWCIITEKNAINAFKTESNTTTLSCGRAKNWSCYLATVPEGVTEIVAATGVDTGKTLQLAKISYINDGYDQNVVIHTNSGKIIINDASSGNIYHYGEADYIDIVQCHLASYHEFGSVAFANIKRGHVTFERGSSVSGVHIEKSGTEVVDGVSYDKFDTVIISFDKAVEQPEYSRDVVNINPAGTKVCTLDLPDETVNIYLYLSGIYEQIKIEKLNLNGEVISEKEWVSASSASLETKGAADQLANMYSGRPTAIGNELDNSVLARESREFLNSTTKENVIEIGIDKETASILVIGVKAYFNVVSDYIEVGLHDFTAKAEEKGISTEGKLNLEELPTPFRAKLDNTYRFKAFENELDEQAITDLFANMGITDDSQLKTVTMADIDDAINASSSVVNKDRLLALIEVRKDFLTWNVDFTISFDHAVSANSVALAGQYDNYSNEWVGFGLPFNMEKNQEFRMLNTAYQATNNEVFRMNYAAICGWVKSFYCGIANLSEDNIGIKAVVTLKLYEVDENGEETGRDVTICSSTVSFTNYQINNR